MISWFKRLILIFVFMAFSMPRLQAQDEYAYVANYTGLGVQFNPEQASHVVYAWKAGLFLSEQWSMNFLWQLAFEKIESSRAGLGLEYLIIPHAEVSPYVDADFMYQYRPSNQIGARLAAGVEYDLVSLTGMDNLRLRGEVAYTELFEQDVSSSNSRLDIIPIAVAWHF